MKYIKRELERKFLLMNRTFKAILLTGARQVGKTTMLRHLAEGSGRTFVTMDNARDRELAQSDPQLFFQVYRPPILIDEAQKAPELFETIKILCDETEKKGLFWLTGSESKRLINEAQDSMAGRICILHMYSLSQREKNNQTDLDGFDFSFSSLIKRQEHFDSNNIVNVYDHIWHGGMPDAVSMNEEQMEAFYSSYIETYLMRDAVDDNGIQDTVGFRKVLRACTAFIGRLINYTDLAEAGSISVPTAKSWLKILQNMGIVFLLEPYFNNTLKRMVKTPKLYFYDTGLAAYLAGWSNRTALMNGAASGYFFENYVVGEFVRTYTYAEKGANLYFYRDSNKREIDIIIEQDNILHPVEVKKSTTPDKRIVKTFSVLDKANVPAGNGAIVCMIDRTFPVDEKNCFVPCNII